MEPLDGLLPFSNTSAPTSSGRFELRDGSFGQHRLSYCVFGGYGEAIANNEGFAGRPADRRCRANRTRNYFSDVRWNGTWGHIRPCTSCSGAPIWELFRRYPQFVIAMEMGMPSVRLCSH
jgi:hypothetical protein